MGARLLEKLHAWRGSEPSLSPSEVEMGEHWFYVDSAKAERELGFAARDPQETLYETVAWLDHHFRGKGRRIPGTIAELMGAERGPGMRTRS